MYLGMLLTDERIRVEGLAKAARHAQKQARAYVIGPMGDPYDHEDEDALSDRAMAYDQRMKAEAYKSARKLTDRWLDADSICRGACSEYVYLRSVEALR